MRRLILALSALLVLALLAPIPAMAQGRQSRIRLMHDSPDGPNVDVFVDGARVLENVTYSTTTDYQALAPGKHRVQIAPTGKPANNSVIDMAVDLTGGKPYTVIALGKFDGIKAKLLPDTSKGPSAGHARVRFIHAAADVAPLDIYPSGSAAPVLTDQYFGSADYVNIPAGTYTFHVTPAGTSQVVLTSQQLKFEPGWSYSLVITHPDGTATPIVRASVDRVGGARTAQTQP